jgi:hypothetical protein
MVRVPMNEKWRNLRTERVQKLPPPGRISGSKVARAADVSRVPTGPFVIDLEMGQWNFIQINSSSVPESGHPEHLNETRVKGRLVIHSAPGMKRAA